MFLASVTEGKLLLCTSRDELPECYFPENDTIELRPKSLKTVRDAAYRKVALDAGLAVERGQDLAIRGK